MADEQNLDTPVGEETQAPETAAEVDLATRVQALEEQLAAAQDQALRVAAEMQNVRRRAEQDVEKAHKFALEKFTGDLLAVVDSLERGLELSSPDDDKVKAVREGLELTLKLMLDTLKRYQVEQLDPHGEPVRSGLEGHDRIARPVGPARVPGKAYLAALGGEFDGQIMLPMLAELVQIFACIKGGNMRCGGYGDAALAHSRSIFCAASSMRATMALSVSVSTSRPPSRLIST